MSDLGLFQFRIGVNYDQDVDYRLGYDKSRKDPHVYANSGGSLTWRIHSYRNKTEPRDERWAISAEDTAVAGMPDNPKTAEEIWAHMPLYLCLIDKDIRLSGVGVVQTSPQKIVPEAAGYWRPRPADFQDRKGKTVTAFRLESAAYPGAYLTYNTDQHGILQINSPLGLRDRPSSIAHDLEWLLVPVRATQPA